MPIGPGTRVTQHVELVRELGRGGMGSVWLAHDARFDVEVAVKLIAPDLLARYPQLAARFRVEARAAAQIRSPHVVQILDHGLMADGTPYLVMERLHGQSLEERIGQGRIGPRETAIIVTQTARALDAAHRLGVVHRDIKPDNLFLLAAGGEELFVKVLDFGIAKQTGSSSGLTATGSLLGSVEYMSPEQILRAKGVDHRADLWALGVVAYRMLTGKLPFEGDTAGAVILAIATFQWRPPSELAADLPPAIDAWFQRALHRDLGARFGSAREMARELTTLLVERPSSLGMELAESSEAWLASSGEQQAAARAAAGSGRGERAPGPEPATVPWVPQHDGDETRPMRRDDLDAVGPNEEPEAPFDAKATAPWVSSRDGPDPVTAPLIPAARRPAPVTPLPPTERLGPSPAAAGATAPGFPPAAALTAAHAAAAAPTAASTPRDPLGAPTAAFPPETPAAASAVTAALAAAASAASGGLAPGTFAGASSTAPGAPRAAAAPPARSRRLVLLLAGVGLAGAVGLGAALLATRGAEESDAGAARRGEGSAVASREPAPPPPLLPPAGMVAVPAGRYRIGCDAERDPQCYRDEGPAHDIELAAFALDRHEVTAGDYDRCVADGGCPPAGTAAGCTWQRRGQERAPITCVTAAAAAAYCQSRGARLPTELQWEAAARGPTGSPGAAAAAYPWGEAAPSCERTAMRDGTVARGSKSAGACAAGGPLEVGSRPADRSWAGALDLGGNVREWTASDYGPYPGGRASPNRQGRINRGGSFEMDATELSRAHTRLSDPPGEQRPDLGFRCAADLAVAELGAAP